MRASRAAGIGRGRLDAAGRPGRGDKRQTAMNRRSFFGIFGGASTAAVAAAVATLSPGEAQAYDPGEEETRQRYNPDSENVKAFYYTNGYETLRK